MTSPLSGKVFLALTILWGTTCGEDGEGDEGRPDILRLYEDVFGKSGYKPSVRPKRNFRRPTNVTLDLALAHIIGLDEKNQVLKADVWLRMNWTDEFLTWNSSEYGGIEIITTKAENIWRPDLFLYHNVNHEFESWLEDVVMVSSDGLVDWKAPVVTMSACSVDVTDFPFDTQRCELQFGSWNQDGRHIDYYSKNDKGDLANLIRNVEWDVPRLDAKRSNPLYNGVPYPDVTFTIHMARRSTFYVINMFLPCVLLSFVVAATFYLPPDCGEKISFGVAVLLSLAVFQLLVAEAVPRSENIPAIGRFIFVSMALMALSLVATAFVITLGDSVQESRPVPDWARRFFLKYASRALLMGDQSKHSADERRYNYISQTIRKQHDTNGEVFRNDKCFSTKSRSSVCLHAAHKSEAALKKQLMCLLQVKGAVEEISRYIKKMDTVKTTSNEWKVLARVVDRIFLVLYIIASVITIVVILLSVMGEKS